MANELPAHVGEINQGIVVSIEEVRSCRLSRRSIHFINLHQTCVGVASLRALKVLKVQAGLLEGVGGLRLGRLGNPMC